MNISQIVKESISYSEVARKLGYKYINGIVIKKIKNIISKNNCNYDHFRKGIKSKYQCIQKNCPVCGKIFETLKEHKREKQTCSYACSNTLFRSGPDNGNWKEDGTCRGNSYRSTCFYYHQKKCIICDEKKIVEVHHCDENKKNNSPDNLIPLCPTHHQYFHSRYKYIIEDQINNYINNYIKHHIK